MARCQKDTLDLQTISEKQQNLHEFYFDTDQSTTQAPSIHHCIGLGSEIRLIGQQNSRVFDKIQNN